MQLNEEQTTLATQTAGAEEALNGGGASKVSTGKFKDVESLKKAYGSLESEFTKRCQKIKELEQEIESYKKAETSPKKEECAPSDTGPSADGNAQCGSTKGDDVVKFLQQFPDALKDLGDLEGYLSPQKDYRVGDVERAYVALLMDRAKKSQSDLKNEEYLYGLIKDTPVKDRLIKEYISAVKSTAPDSVLIGGTGSIALTPPMRPKTLAEAKALAEKIIKIK